MRLGVVENGHAWHVRGAFWLLQRIAGVRPPDVMRLATYRPDFFGRRYSDIVHAALRGASPWKVGELELFAAYTSHRHQCPF